MASAVSILIALGNGRTNDPQKYQVQSYSSAVALGAIAGIHAARKYQHVKFSFNSMLAGATSSAVSYYQTEDYSIRIRIQNQKV